MAEGAVKNTLSGLFNAKVPDNLSKALQSVPLAITKQCSRKHKHFVIGIKNKIPLIQICFAKIRPLRSKHSNAALFECTSFKAHIQLEVQLNDTTKDIFPVVTRGDILVSKLFLQQLGQLEARTE